MCRFLKTILFSFLFIGFTFIFYSRTEYIVDGAKISRVKFKNSNKSDFVKNNNVQRNNSYSQNNELQSAMMQLQEQLLNLSNIVEKNSSYISRLENQNAKLSDLIIALESKISLINNSKKEDVNPTKKPKKNNEEKKQLNVKERIVKIKKMITVKQYTKAISEISNFLEINSNSTYADEFYFLRGFAYFRKGMYQLSTEDFVESYSKKPKGKRAKYVLYFLSKSLKKIGKKSDAEIIEGKINVDFHGFDVKKEYGVEILQ